MIAAALVEARKQVAMGLFGRDWKVSTWDAGREAWVESTSRDFWSARSMQTRAIVRQALIAMGATARDADTAAHEGHEQAWHRGRARVEDVLRAAIMAVRDTPSRWCAETLTAARAAQVRGAA